MFDKTVDRSIDPFLNKCNTNGEPAIATGIKKEAGRKGGDASAQEAVVETVVKRSSMAVPSRPRVRKEIPKL